MRGFFRCLLVGAGALALCGSVCGQSTLPSSARPMPIREQRPSQREAARRMEDMWLMEQQLRASAGRRRENYVSPRLSGEERKRMLRLRRVEPDDAALYSAFLDLPRTGIFKLFPDLDCVTRTVFRIDGACAQFVPESSYFAFRTGSYMDATHHDIRYDRGRLSSNSFFSQGILVSLGDVPLETVNLGTKGLSFLTRYGPAPDPVNAAIDAERFRAGVESDGHLYSESVVPKDNNTYALRFIGYRLANSLPLYSEESTQNELLFYSLRADKRVDSIVVFRVVRTDELGGLTIVWQELQRKEAPKLRFPKGVEMADFRTAANQRK